MDIKQLEKLGKGCIPDIPDDRDIIYEEACGAGEPVNWNKSFDIEYKTPHLLKVESQNGSSSCVSQAFAYYAEILEMLENNRYTDLSARDIYSRIYLPNGGAYLRDGAKTLVNHGICEEKLAPSYECFETKDINGSRLICSPPSEKFMRIIPENGKDNAGIYASKSYARIQGNNDIDKMAEIIRDNHGCVSGVRGSNQGWTTSHPRPPKNGEKEWSHALFFTSYKQVAGKKYIGFINSWGKNWGNAGRGWLGEEYFGKHWLFSAWTLVDKKNIINFKNMRYVIYGIDQYLLDDKLKIAFSIADERELDLLLKRGLTGAPEKIDTLKGYLIYRGATEERWKEFLNL